MISREYSEFILTCDNCGEEIAGFNDLTDCIEYMEEHEWEGSRDVDISGSDRWEDVCEQCVKRINERSLSQKA